MAGTYPAKTKHLRLIPPQPIRASSLGAGDYSIFPRNTIHYKGLRALLAFVPLVTKFSKADGRGSDLPPLAR